MDLLKTYNVDGYTDYYCIVSSDSPCEISLRPKWIDQIVKGIKINSFIGGFQLISPTTWIQARTEGSRSNDTQKYHKDAMLLQKELENPECDKARTLFYLAQSYRDSQNKEQAIKYYKQRAVLPNSWVEEQYVSYLNLIRFIYGV